MKARVGVSIALLLAVLGGLLTCGNVVTGAAIAVLADQKEDVPGMMLCLEEPNFFIAVTSL